MFAHWGGGTLLQPFVPKPPLRAHPPPGSVSVVLVCCLPHSGTRRLITPRVLQGVGWGATEPPHKLSSPTCPWCTWEEEGLIHGGAGTPQAGSLLMTSPSNCTILEHSRCFAHNVPANRHPGSSQVPFREITQNYKYAAEICGGEGQWAAANHRPASLWVASTPPHHAPGAPSPPSTSAHYRLPERPARHQPSTWLPSQCHHGPAHTEPPRAKTCIPSRPDEHVLQSCKWCYAK